MVEEVLSASERMLLGCFRYTDAKSNRSLSLVQLKIELNNAFDVTAIADGLVSRGVLSQPVHRFEYTLTTDGHKLLGLTEA